MFTKNFQELSKADVAVAGGKGASLGEMTRAGIAVPPGFVIVAVAFDRFLEEADLRVEIEAAMHHVNHQDINSIETISNKIRDCILDAEFPKDLGKEVLSEFQKLKTPLVAVRSSATAEDSSIASWAGELETYLNTDKKKLLDNIQKCWASLFTPRAIFYRVEKKMHTRNVSVAVVVQAMIQSEISGVCFTVHPVTNDVDQLVIEAGYGLGEAIVGGKITPDTYVLHKKTWGFIDKNVSLQKMMIVRNAKGVMEKRVPQAKRAKQKLEDKKIIALAKLCQTIERHYQRPQDIEWAYEKGKFYITQSRPITTL